MIRYSALCDNDKQHRKKIDEQEILFDKMSRQLVEMNNNVLRLQEKILEKETKILELEECVRNKDLEIEKCLERLNDCENKLHKIGQTSQTIHMIMPSKDKMYDGRKGNSKQVHSNPMLQQLILEKIIIELEEEVLSLLEKEKENLEIIESLKSKGSELSENAISDSENQSENDCHEVEKDLETYSKLNKDVKRYSRKDLLSCNNSHREDTRGAHACNDAMSVSCNSRLYASCDVNELFVFDDHLTGNHTLLTNFMEKFLGMVRFGNDDFAVIALAIELLLLINEG
ncbi:hypothetical protein Tco_0682660 [Tanacetum coccineum]|uniref:Uncharacterized protein n=1 Tax=Tanacetum coccineum TaxID=301880 RepID=A0ABQ4XTD6_9ASTR